MFSSYSGPYSSSAVSVFHVMLIFDLFHLIHFQKNPTPPPFRILASYRGQTVNIGLIHHICQFWPFRRGPTLATISPVHRIEDLLSGGLIDLLTYLIIRLLAPSSY